MNPTMTAWHETPAWLQILHIDADIYRDHNLATIVRLARRGCPVSLANASRMYSRTYLGGAS